MIKNIGKNVEATRDLTENKIDDKFTKNNLETDSKTEGISREIPKIYMCHQKETASYWWSKINILI